MKFFTLSSFIVLTFIFTFLPKINSQPEPVWTDNCLALSSTSTCTQCIEGFYLVYFVCMPCAPLCKCSSQYNYCQSCLSLTYKNTQYNITPYLKLSEGRCYFCQNFLPYCIACSSEQMCTKCGDGYYVSNITENNNIIGAQCLYQCQTDKNVSHCEVCANQKQCEYCQPSFYLEQNSKVCVQCVANCLECDSKDSCKICMDQYYLDLNETGTHETCQPCIGNCTYCINSTGCEVCFPGYYFDEGECVPSQYSNCIGYAGQGALAASGCSVCQPGYYVLYGSCYPCEGCELCSLAFICYSKCFADAVAFNYACITSSFSEYILVFWVPMIVFLIYF